ncbi:MAG: diaminopimelate epimerase [Elusimicrobiota bacterium]
MGQKIKFTKMHGSGNDFVMLDNRANTLPENKNLLAQRLCDRIAGIGADGLIIIESSNDSDFKMRIINQDGSEAEMCGNGARCAAHFAYSLGIVKNKMKFTTLAGPIGAEIVDDKINVRMIDPVDFEKDIELDLDKFGKMKAYYINTGVPHVVIFVDDIDDVDVKEMGRSIRYNKHFKPKGTNVNFVQVINSEIIKVRTYERGVENETLACGSGSTAAAIISGLEKGAAPPVKAHTRGGEILEINFKIEKYDEIREVYLKGSVHVSFHGEMEI